MFQFLLFPSVQELFYLTSSETLLVSSYCLYIIIVPWFWTYCSGACCHTKSCSALVVGSWVCIPFLSAFCMCQLPFGLHFFWNGLIPFWSGLLQPALLVWMLLRWLKYPSPAPVCQSIEAPLLGSRRLRAVLACVQLREEHVWAIQKRWIICSQLAPSGAILWSIYLIHTDFARRRYLEASRCGEALCYASAGVKVAFFLVICLTIRKQIRWFFAELLRHF